MNGAGPTEHPPVVDGCVSRNKPAPSSFTDPLWVIVPSYSIEAPYKCLQWGAIHGVTLPAQGAEVSVVMSLAGVPTVVWWAGETVQETVERGTSLPASPVDGQEYDFIVNATAGVVWRFRYRAASASTYKWEFIGGPPLYSEVATNQAVESPSPTYADLATVGPEVTLPLPGDYDIEIGMSTEGRYNGTALMSYAIGATAAKDEDAVVYGSGQASSEAGDVAASMVRSKRKTGLTAETLTAKYCYSKGGSGAIQLENRFMRVTPVRVG